MSSASVKIKPGLKAELEKFAAETKRDQTELVNEALEEYLEREKRNLARIREGLAQAKRGDFVSESEVHEFYAKRTKRSA